MSAEPGERNIRERGISMGDEADMQRMYVVL